MKLCEMKIRDVIQSRLWITGGQKCVSVEASAGLQLVTQSLQDGNKGLVEVYDIMYGKKKCMAFCFKVGGDAIFPFTDGKDIQFTVLSSKQKVTLNEMYLFQWGGRGTTDWRSLKSMAGPSMYLFAEDNENKVTIKPIEMPHFRIEKKGKTLNIRTKTPYERVSLVSQDSNYTATKGKAQRFRRS